MKTTTSHPPFVNEWTTAWFAAKDLMPSWLWGRSFGRSVIKRIGSHGVYAARERRTRTALRRSAQRQARRTKVIRRAMGRDIARYGLIGSLVRIIGDCGLTMTLNGKPVSEQMLREYALASAVDRLAAREK